MYNPCLENRSQLNIKRKEILKNKMLIHQVRKVQILSNQAPTPPQEPTGPDGTGCRTAPPMSITSKIICWLSLVRGRPALQHAALPHGHRACRTDRRPQSAALPHHLHPAAQCRPQPFRAAAPDAVADRRRCSPPRWNSIPLGTGAPSPTESRRVFCCGRGRGKFCGGTIFLDAVQF